MKRVIFLLPVLVITLIAAAQSQPGKKLLSNDVFIHSNLGNTGISPDGKLLWYIVREGFTPTLTLQTPDGSYKKEFVNAGEDGVFTTDNRYFLVKVNDSIIIMNLKSKDVRAITHVSQMKYCPAGKLQGLFYQQDQSLYWEDLAGNKSFKLDNVSNYQFSKSNTSLYIQSPAGTEWVSIPEGKRTLITRNPDASSFTFDDKGGQLVFYITHLPGMNVMYYKPGMDSAALLVNNTTSGIKPGWFVSDQSLTFSPDGQHLYFSISRSVEIKRKEKSVITGALSLWHYKDDYLQSEQLLNEDWKKPPQLRSVINTNGPANIVCIESTDTSLYGNIGNKYVLTASKFHQADAYWNAAIMPHFELLNIETGARMIIPNKGRRIISLWISPDEKFLLIGDSVSKQITSYEIATGHTYELTSLAPTSFISKFPNRVVEWGFYSSPIWMEGSKAVFFSDQYDLWQLDPLGVQKPICVTNGYGREHQTSFRMLPYFKGSVLYGNEEIMTKNLWLAAFNRYTKDNGFFKVTAGQQKTPEKASMEACLSYYPGLFAGASIPDPVKAANAEAYLIQKQRADMAPNLFYTTDFKNFIPITSLAPQKEYNWMTSELIHWKINDTAQGAAVLYKPENFDPSKKYPVIFTYYEERTDQLHLFQPSGLSEGPIEIPWYTSHGYMVLVPDIIRPTGNPAGGLLQTIESAARYLAKLPYVDGAHLGLNGHSFGGHETNLIAARSHLFAAAQSSAGGSNAISMYGYLSFGQQSLNYYQEVGQGNMGVPPSVNPAIYEEFSPVLYLSGMTTPLLMEASDEDPAMPFAQAIELFTSMRRLQKPVWMLCYKGDGHALYNQANKLDFTIRQQQFFDHYLKGAPMPRWMAEPIPASEGGKRSGLELMK